MAAMGSTRGSTTGVQATARAMPGRNGPGSENLPEPELITDPVEAAKAAGLRYSTDTGPGITRKRAGRSWSYVGLDGKPIKDPAALKRIKALGIPPAYTDVWINPDPKGHV